MINLFFNESLCVFVAEPQVSKKALKKAEKALAKEAKKAATQSHSEAAAVRSDLIEYGELSLLADSKIW